MIEKETFEINEEQKTKAQCNTKTFLRFLLYKIH